MNEKNKIGKNLKDSTGCWRKKKKKRNDWLRGRERERGRKKERENNG